MRLLKAMPCLLLTFLAVLSCRKESESLSPLPPAEYYPLRVGQSLVYRLDSTLYVSFGTRIKVNSYLAKDSIAGTAADNLGRTTYVVYRYLTDTLQKNPYTFSSSYTITPAGSTIEATDADNLRYIKLVQPINVFTSWSGNSYIDVSSDRAAYLSGWQYQYRNINQPFTVLAGTLDSTITVLQDSSINITDPFVDTVLQNVSYSSEVYAKGIGLIYKDLSYYMYQPVGTITPGYTAQSFGIRLNLISYR